MGQTIDYHQAGMLTLADILRLEQHARERLVEFRGFEPDTELDLFCKREQLPQPDHFSGLTITGVTITGTLARSSDPCEPVTELLAQGEAIRRTGVFTVYLEFSIRLPQGPVRQRLYLQGRADREQIGFGCELSGRTLTGAAGLRASQLQTLIDQTRLPLSIHWQDKDYFLHAPAGDVIWITRAGIRRDNPSAFRYRLTATSLSEASDYLQRVIAAQDSSTRYRLDWTAASTGDAAALYQAVATASPAARDYELQLQVKLQELAALEAIQAFCGEKDRVFTPLGSYRPDDYNYINFDIVTTRAGHRIQAESKAPVDIGEINRLLGLNLQETASPL